MITADGTVPPDMLSAGIGMSGAPTMIVQAVPNLQTMFTPRPRYRVAFGQVKPRQILGPAPLPNSADIEFPPNIFSMTATLNINYTWTIEVNPLPMAMEIPPPPEAQL
ncbi:MAG: hypothetical protein DMF56_26140 [Acidobacteria bacterium]|nr:MAG: hypothetical protein DMF56_26140 [Acidobacteriota bacterium]